MAKKIVGLVKLALNAGKATPAPPVGPALGQYGANIVMFCKEYNARTSNSLGLVIPVEITIYDDRSFSFILKTPPASVLLAKAAGVSKGSGTPNSTFAGSISKEQLQEIAKTKLPDLNTMDITKAMRIVAGTAKKYGNRNKMLVYAERNLKMPKSSRRYNQLLKKITKSSYSPLEAVELLPDLSNVNFVETVDVHISLGLDPKYADQQLRATVILPKGTGKKVSVAVIAQGEHGVEALAAGADIVGSNDLIEEISKGRLDFDKLIATPDLMPSIARLGRLLGPKGLMPSPKAGTVTYDLSKAIAEFKAGKLEYRVDRTGIVHIPCGKANFDSNDLLLNLISIKDSIEKNRPSGAKGKYWKSVYISTTMSPSIPIEVNLFRELSL